MPVFSAKNNGELAIVLLQSATTNKINLNINKINIFVKDNYVISKLMTHFFASEIMVSEISGRESEKIPPQSRLSGSSIPIFREYLKNDREI